MDRAVEERQARHFEVEQARPAARQQLGGDAGADVVRHEMRAADAELSERDLEQVRLLDERVAKSGGLVRKAVAGEVERHHAPPLPERVEATVKVERRGGK